MKRPTANVCRWSLKIAMADNETCDYFIGKPSEGDCRRCGLSWARHYPPHKEKNDGHMPTLRSQHRLGSGSLLPGRNKDSDKG